MNCNTHVKTAAADPTAAKQMERPSGAWLVYVQTGPSSGVWKAKEGTRAACHSIEATINPHRQVIDVDYATIYHPLVPTAVRELIEQFPQLGSYHVTFDAHKVPAADVAAFQHDPDWIVRWWFHGTSSAFLPQIMQQGLSPRGVTGREPSFQMGANPSNPSLVYLASDDGNDVRFAAREANNKAFRSGLKGKALILKIDGSKLAPDKMVADEDSQRSDWKDSIAFIGTAAYKGIIRPAAIKPHLTIGADGSWVSAEGLI